LGRKGFTLLPSPNAISPSGSVHDKLELELEISTIDNTIAGDISGIKRESVNEDSSPFFGYSNLTQMYPELIHCSSFMIQPELISLIWEIVFTKRWPCHDEMRKLILKPLGKLITFSGD